MGPVQTDVSERMNDLKVFSGRANPQLAQEICDYLGITLGEVEIRDFPDQETFCKVEEDIRGRDVFLVQPTCPPGNNNLMELLILIDSCLRASADRITAVIPYYGYARQDRKDVGRVPITAKLVANLITRAGADRVLTMDLHAAQIQGFFDVPVDHLYARPVLDEYFLGLGLPSEEIVVVSPDLGRVKEANKHAARLGAAQAIIEKRRRSDEQTEQVNLIGESVAGKIVLMFDDMISTAGTIVGATNIVSGFGAREVYVSATHGVLCGSALQRLSEAPVREVVITNTIPLRPEVLQAAKHDASGRPAVPNIKVLSVAKLIGEAIKRIHRNESVSKLFPS